MGMQDEQLDEEAIENYYRTRYNEDEAAIARLAIFFLNDVRVVLALFHSWSNIK